MHEALGQVGAVMGNVLDQAVVTGELKLKPAPPAMKFVGFKVDGVPEGRLTADTRTYMGKAGRDTGKPWQSGVIIVAPEDIAMDAPASTILRACRFYRWILDPGRMTYPIKRVDGTVRAPGGIYLNEKMGFVMPSILATWRVSMYCAEDGCGKDAFFTWSNMLAVARHRALKKTKSPRPELPRLTCIACGKPLETRPLKHPRLLTGYDAGYATVEHPDLQGFAQAYVQDQPMLASIFPRLWAVYDAHLTPDNTWKPEDALAEEIQNRMLTVGRAIRPLARMIESGGQPRPKHFVIEASPVMKYGWMEEKDLYYHQASATDYRKRLVQEPIIHPVVRESYSNDIEV